MLCCVWVYRGIGSAPTSVVRTDPILVVCARWCPTLPHPGGCSTIGAVRLSFRVRDGYRAFPCRCDHRDDWLGCACVRSSWRVSRYLVVVWPPLQPTLTHEHAGCLCVVGGWVGCGPYSGRSRLLLVLTPHHTLLACVCCDWGCCCLCWPISTSQLCRPLPVFHSWPINPVVCWGPTRTPRCPVETLS